MVYLELLRSLSKLMPVYDNFIKFPKDTADCIEVWWGDPSVWEWSRESEIKIGYALSEAESLLTKGRKETLENISKCDMLICPSEFSTRAYKESPIDVPIRVVPLGYNPDSFPYMARSWVAPIRVLLAGSAQMRKGTQQGIDGFLRAFGTRSKFQLTVWSSVKTPLREQLKNDYASMPNIIFDDGQYDNPNEVYNKHHILLHPHLSEGFGIIPIEAMSNGLVVLLSRVSSPMEYFSKDVGYWIEMSEDYVPVRECLENTNGFWRLPDVASIAQNLKYIASHRGEAKKKTFVANDWVKQWTWDESAKKLISLIKEEFDADFGDDRSGI